MKLRQSATPVVRYIRLLLNRYPIVAPRKQIQMADLEKMELVVLSAALLASHVGGRCR